MNSDVVEDGKRDYAEQCKVGVALSGAVRGGTQSWGYSENGDNGHKIYCCSIVVPPSVHAAQTTETRESPRNLYKGSAAA